MQTIRTAIYCRMSKDKTGAGLGVERQERECRELIAQLEGHEVVEVFIDNDLSASSGKPRPGYLAMLNAIRSGRVDIVVAWHTDRLHRSPVELEEYIALSAPTHTVKAGALDLATPAGRMAARTFGAVARYEIEQKSERQKSKNRQVALSGAMPSGGPTPWGYADDRINLHPINSVRFQDAHRRVLGGESFGSVIRSLNDAGVPAPRGGRWSYSTLRGVLLRPLNAGLMLHDGVILTNVQSNWTPLVTVEEHHAMATLMSDPNRRTTTGNARKHLLAGIATCGNCGKGLKSGAVGSRSGKVAYLYRCGNVQCTARVNVARDKLDAYVTDRLLVERGGAWVARAKVAENIGALVTEVDNKLAGIGAHIVQPGADVATLMKRVEVLQGERAELMKPQRSGWRLTNVTGDWDRAQDVTARREILLSHLGELTIASRGKTSHRFDSGRVTLTWLPDPYDADEDMADNRERWEADWPVSGVNETR